MQHKIVFLDSGTVGPDVEIRRPDFDHVWEEHERTSPDQVTSRLEGATIAITNKVKIGEDVLAALPDLKFIAVAATGYDVVDIAACDARDIPVSNIRGYAVNTVPEHTFALITALRRNLIEYRDQTLAGMWEASGQFCFFNRPIWDLAGSTLGILGTGAIGTSVGRIGCGFGMEVIYHNDRATTSPDTGALVSRDELRERSDVLTLHCPLTEKTRNIIDADFLDGMKPTSIIINTARGGLIDEVALTQAIESGQIAGAGLDVAESEPARLGEALLSLAKRPNVILTPHVAWASVEARQTLFDQLIDNLELFHKGQPANLVTA